MQQHDVIIVGAGVIGLTCACALAKTGLSVVVIDKSDVAPAFSKDQYDVRVSAITHASQAIFRNIDVWDAMKTRRVSPYHDMHVWEDTHEKAIHFSATQVGESTLGHIIENNVMQTALLEQVSQLDSVQLVAGCTLQTCDIDDDRVTLHAQDGGQWQAKLIIGADGAHSWLRQHCGIAQQQQPYQHTAIVATIQSEQSHQLTAWQRFTADGPLAFLPLADVHHSSIVWSTTPTRADALMGLSHQDFATALSDVVNRQFGAVTLLSSRYAFPLIMRHAQQYVLPRVALIGDAAHTIHPLAGQGMNLGLLDAACLAQTVQRAQQRQRDIGSLMTLQRYARWRRSHNVLMIKAMDGFKTLFASQNHWVKQLRHHGLAMTNRLPIAKHTLMRYAMGLQGDLPMLARM